MSNIQNWLGELTHEKKIEGLKLLKDQLERFKFRIPEEQLSNLEITHYDNERIEFFNRVSGEKYFGFYTEYAPQDPSQPTYYGRTLLFRTENN